ncbi:hypothetical protein R1sor_012856 [Riccia sorocarpa]|uniref:Uncharacterized protein n=1 Tax=Riccia sorocarpa TaxID=122646 RepID=A0ABD3I8R0_9MARC
MNRRLKELLELEEKREMAFENQCRTQLKRKKYIDGYRKIFNLKKDDKVLHCVATGKIKSRKLTYIWEGPFNVDEVSSNGNILISNGNILISNEDKTNVRLVNGNKLRPYGTRQFLRGDPFIDQVEQIIREADNNIKASEPGIENDQLNEEVDCYCIGWTPETFNDVPYHQDVQKVYPDGSDHFPDMREVLPDGKLNNPEKGWYHPDVQRVIPFGQKYLPDQEAAQPKDTRVTKSRSGLGVVRGVERKQAYTSRVRRTDRNSKTELNQLSEKKWAISDDSKGVNVQSKGRAEGISLIESLKLVGKPNRKGVYRVRVERKLQSPFVSPYRNRALVLGSGKAINMGRKPASSKIVEEAKDASLPENLIVTSKEQVAGHKTFDCYCKEIDRIDWDDEKRASYWLKQFGALTALRLTHIEPDLIAKLVNAYNPVTNRIYLNNHEDVLCESMICDVFQLSDEGPAVSRKPEIPHEWISYCYPEYAIPEKKDKEYYAATRCTDPEWKNKISWVLRYMLGQAEGREIPKGVLAAMIQAEVEGQVVNWATIVFERIRGELRRLKAIRKGDHLRTEAGPQLTMVAEYIAYEKKDKDKAQKKIMAAPTVSSTPSGRRQCTRLEA